MSRTGVILKVLNVEPEDYSPAARAILSRFAEVTEKRLSREELLRVIGDYDVLVVRLAHAVDREVLTKAARLKAVVSATTGLNHIDVAFAESRGIAVLSLKGETDFLNDVTATAEHAWGLILALNRKIVHAHVDVVSGRWRRDHFRGHELKEKTIGIVGYGRLGKMVARYARAFRMRVLVCDPYVDAGLADGIERTDLDGLLRESDVVSLHVPLNAETTGLIGRERLGVMKSSAVLVNTSRGEVVDEAALLVALKGGRLAGAALDVLCGEAKFRASDGAWPAGDPLTEYARKNGNLILTPHIGGATFESMAATEVFMAEKLERFLKSV